MGTENLGQNLTLTNYFSSLDLWTDSQAAKTWRRMIAKRLYQVIQYLVALFILILSAPVMSIIAFLIKVESPGPIIFKQIRVGKNHRCYNGDQSNNCRRKIDIGGRPFVFYKFRTMWCDAKNKYPELYRYQYTAEEIQRVRFKLERDPRLTVLGRHLRKTTLDELPNLLNVLKGEMNLVGPRPDIPEMVKYYQDWQKNKFEVKPGVTGLAQVNGRGILSFQQTLKHDVDYVKNRKVSLDLKILAKTIRATFLRIGAF